MTSSTYCSFRLSTVQAADKIVAMDSGRVVEVSHSHTRFDEFVRTVALGDNHCYVFVHKTDGQSQRAFEQRWLVCEID